MFTLDCRAAYRKLDMLDAYDRYEEKILRKTPSSGHDVWAVPILEGLTARCILSVLSRDVVIICDFQQNLDDYFPINQRHPSRGSYLACFPANLAADVENLSAWRRPRIKLMTCLERIFIAFASFLSFGDLLDEDGTMTLCPSSCTKQGLCAAIDGRCGWLFVGEYSPTCPLPFARPRSLIGLSNLSGDQEIAN